MRQLLYPDLIPTGRKRKPLKTYVEGPTRCVVHWGREFGNVGDAAEGEWGPTRVMKGVCAQQDCRQGVWPRTSQVCLKWGTARVGAQENFQGWWGESLLNRVLVTRVYNFVKTLWTILFKCVHFIVCKLCLSQAAEKQKLKTIRKVNESKYTNFCHSILPCQW